MLSPIRGRKGPYTMFSKTVRASIFAAALIVFLAAVPAVADDDSWYFDMDSGTQYDFSTNECWLTDGTAGTPQWTDENLWCETPNVFVEPAVEHDQSHLLEEGATFGEGVCWEADGTEGIPALDGSCVTPADYDAIYNVEVLAETPSLQDPTMSIAEVYEMDVTDPTPASDKPIGEGLVAVPFTFKEYVQAAHMPIAD